MRKLPPGLLMATDVASPAAKALGRGLDTTFNAVSAVRAVLSPLVRGAALLSESSSESQGWPFFPPTPWALTASFLCWHSWASKIGSASALSGFPLKFVKQSRQHWQPLMITPPPTDAMGDSSLFFVLASLGRQKFGSASALSGFPLEFFLRGRTKQRRQPLTVTVSRVVGSPVGGYIGGLLVVPLGLYPGCCLGVANSATGPSQAVPVLGVCRVAFFVGSFGLRPGLCASGRLRFLPSHLGWARGPSPHLLTHHRSVCRHPGHHR
jgi:hypothetical protein